MVGEPDQADVLAADVAVDVHGDLAGVSEVAHLEHHAAALEHFDALDERRGRVGHIEHDVGTATVGQLLDLGDPLLGRGRRHIKRDLCAAALGEGESVLRQVRGDDLTGAHHVGLGNVQQA